MNNYLETSDIEIQLENLYFNKKIKSITFTKEMNAKFDKKHKSLF